MLDILFLLDYDNSMRPRLRMGDTVWVAYGLGLTK